MNYEKVKKKIEQQDRIERILVVGALILVFILCLSGCATTKKDKVDTIVEQEIKKEYKLPELTQCEEPLKLKDFSLQGYYQDGKYLQQLLKDCSTYNQEKIDWLNRNFGDKK